jgi:hypothetical protein
MKNKKVIYHGFTEGKEKIINYLYDKYGWEPILISGPYYMKHISEKEYPDIVFVDTMEVRKAIFDYSKIGKPIPIDAELIKSLSHFELNFLGILEDTSGWNFSYYERKRFYFDILKFWNTAIHNHQPNLFISFTWPHTPTEYSLYLLCKYHFDIELMFLNPVPFFNRKCHIVGNSLENLHSPFIDYYNSTEKIEPSNNIKKYISDLRKPDGKKPKYIKEFDAIADKDSEESRLKNFIKFLISSLQSRSMFKKVPIAWKKNRKPYYSSDSRMNYLEYNLFLFFLNKKNKKLINYYKPLCVEPDFNEKFLYFAAPYQPEAVTGNNAGVYDDILLALDILSSVIPDDWVIYYKEHYFTFSNSLWSKGSIRRDKHFYKKINEYNNIEFVSTDINSFKLIDNSQAVATVSGTTSWEAAARGKPSLSFGSSWYMGCKSIFWIKTLEDAQKAVDKVICGFVPIKSDIEHYAASIEKYSFDGIGLDSFLQSKSDDIINQYETIAEAFYKSYKRYYGNN